MNVLLFKWVQLSILGILILFISDFRKKKDMAPLIGEKWTCLLKAAYLIPLALYVHTLLPMQSVARLDFVALGMTSLGTFLVVRAKRDLATHHTWAGYCLTTAPFTTRGIYAHIRHPLYTGVTLVILGSLFTIIPRLNLSSSPAFPVAALLSVSYVLCFLFFMANRETHLLLEKYGSLFRHYRDSVHPFLPLGTYAAPGNGRERTGSRPDPS